MFHFNDYSHVYVDTAHSLQTTCIYINPYDEKLYDETSINYGARAIKLWI